MPKRGGDVLSAPVPEGGMQYLKTTSSLLTKSAAASTQREQRKADVDEEYAADVGTSDLGAAETLRQILRHKFGHVVRGWREALDHRASHHVGVVDFSNALRKLGFKGDLKLAWGGLDGQKGSVTLVDLDPKAATNCSEFYNWWNEKVGPLEKLVENTDAQRLEKKAFLKACEPFNPEKNTDLDLEALFQALNTHGNLTLADLNWLTKYCDQKKWTKPEVVTKDYGEKATKNSQKLALQAFRELMQHKFGGVIPAFRLKLAVPDKEDEEEGDEEEDAEKTVNHDSLMRKLGKLGFMAGLDEKKAEKKFESLWNELANNDEEIDSVTLDVLEPRGKEALKVFKQKCLERFGSMSEMFTLLDAPEKPVVARTVFARLCGEIRMHHDVELLFQYLDERLCGHILLSSIDKDLSLKMFGGEEGLSIHKASHEGIKTMPRKAVRETLRVQARRQCGQSQRAVAPSQRQNLLKAIELKFGSAARAWRAVFDVKGAGKINKSEFLVGCSVVGYGGRPQDLWKEFGLTDKQSLRFRDLAPEAIAECSEFKALYKEECGSLQQALEQAQCTTKGDLAAAKLAGSIKNPRINAEQLAGLCRQLGYTGSPEKLFAHLDIANRGMISEKSLKWLAETQDMEKDLASTLRKHTTNQQKAWRAKQEANNVGPHKELLKTQDEIRAKSRTDRDAKKELEQTRDKLLKKLSAKFGTVAKAWRVAMDPENNGFLDYDGWNAGLSRAGLVTMEAEQEEVDKYDRLFTHLCPKDPDTGEVDEEQITIDELDPVMTKLLSEFHARVAARFGGMMQAFEQADPVGTGTISVELFKELLQEAKVTNGKVRLAQYFDKANSGSIELEDIDPEAAEWAKKAAEARQTAEERRDKQNEKRSHMLGGPPDVGVRCGVEARQEDRRARPALAALAEAKRLLCNKYGNTGSDAAIYGKTGTGGGTIVQAWRKTSLGKKKKSKDPTPKRASKEAFVEACATVGMNEDKADLAWEAIGVRGDSVSITQLEPGLVEDFRAFREHLKERYWKIESAFSDCDEDGSFQLSWKEFLALCYEVQFKRNEIRLFEFLDWGQTGSVKMSDIDSKAVDEVKRIRAEQEEADRRHAEKVRQQVRDKKVAAGEEVEPGDDAGEIPAAVEDAEPPPPAHREPERAFRACLARRLGPSVVLAWRVLDKDCRGVLSKPEFLKSVAATGYGGSANLLWDRMNAEEKVSIREVDPETFALLATFRRCVNKKMKGLQNAFKDAEQEPTVQFDKEKFLTLCRSCRVPKPWASLFQQLDTQRVGSVSWDDVKFLEEQWIWSAATEKPRRRPLAALTTSTASLDRTAGMGPLATTSRPQRVGLQKSSSLPSLRSRPSPTASPQLRDAWNNRHHMLDRRVDKTMQMLHYMTAVSTVRQVQVQQRACADIRKEPTHQWFEENLPDHVLEALEAAGESIPECDHIDPVTLLPPVGVKSGTDVYPSWSVTKTHNAVHNRFPF